MLLSASPFLSADDAEAQSTTTTRTSTTTSTATTSSANLRYGMSYNSMNELTSQGIKPAYATIWLGPWTNQSWTGFNTFLNRTRDAGVTPFIHWYYWGDDISPTCVENGCYSHLHKAQKTKSEWYFMLNKLTDNIRRYGGGQEVLVIVETEFNKGGITTSTYAPTFDQYLVEHMRKLESVQGVRTVSGFGNWGHSLWSRFPGTIQEADFMGFQTMVGSTRENLQTYMAAGTNAVNGALWIKNTYGKPSILTDLAISSYTMPLWATYQDQALRQVLSRSGELQAAGVQGIIYRSLRDVLMDPANYYGYAEQHWGFMTRTGEKKPSWSVWAAAAQGQNLPPTPARAVPDVIEAESFYTRTSGEYNRNASTSGGYTWLMRSSSEMGDRITVPTSGWYNVSFTAKGSPVSGQYARMAIVVDGTVAREATVARDFASYGANVHLTAGTHSLRLRFQNPDPAQNRLVQVDTLSVQPGQEPNQQPVARFTSAISGLNVRFDASASSDPEGQPLTYHWNFGDGTTGTGETVTKRFTESGTYTVRLTVRDPEGLSRTTGRILTLTGEPYASFTTNTSGRTVTFDASTSTAPGGEELTYSWNFGDGTLGAGQRVTHTYARAGDYNVTLRVRDPSGLSSLATSSVPITAENRAPVPEFNVTTQNRTAVFNARASFDPDGDRITSYRWSFGDGTSTTGSLVAKTYSRAGTYNVTLRVFDVGGAIGTLSQQVTVNSPPVANFTFTTSDLTARLDARASRDPDGGALTYRWAFGDGTTGTGAMPEKTFAQPGTYHVRLTVTDPDGFSHAVTHSVTVRETYTPSLVEAEAFSDRSIGSILLDPTASGGAAWNVNRNGSIREPVTVSTTGTYTIAVRAKGVPAAGVMPVMEIRMNSTVLSSVSVTREWTEYRVPINLVKDVEYRFSVRFLNDLRTSTTDRDLHVDRAAFALGTPATDTTTTATTVNREVEDFPRKSTGSRVADASASEGAVWALFVNGAVQTDDVTTTSSGTHTLRVFARGTPANGAWPTMRVLVDGSTIGSVNVASRTLQNYDLTVDLSPGVHSVRLVYGNNVETAKEDRNVFLDRVSLITGTAPAPSDVTVEESPPDSSTITTPPGTVTSLARQAEDFARKSTGARETDLSASARAVWALYSNGFIQDTMVVDAEGEYTFTLTARGTPVNGVWPRAVVSVNGVNVATFNVDSTTLTTYSRAITLDEGSNTIRVSYVNNWATATENRDVFLDRVTLRSR